MSGTAVMGDVGMLPSSGATSGYRVMSGARGRRRDAATKPNHERWMISYADLLTLLLALFIVLYATSVQNTAKLKAASASMMEAFTGTPPSVVAKPSSPHGAMHNLPKPVPIPYQAPSVPKVKSVPHSLRRINNNPAHPLQVLSIQEQKALRPSVLAIKRLYDELRRLMAPEIAQHTIDISDEPLRIRIRLNAKILFPNGKAKLTPAAVNLLTPVASVLSTIPKTYMISIRGYTDNKPIDTPAFPSNWQLSTARALSVVLLFRSNHVAGESLSAAGFSKYHPIETNKTAAGREKNRRVSIIITAPAGPFKARGHEIAKSHITETGQVTKPTSGVAATMQGGDKQKGAKTHG